MAFKVYINGYLDEDGNIIESSSDALMFEVPLTDTSPVSDPSVKSQVGMADSFDFSMEVNSDYYDKLVPLKTRFKVMYDNDAIFYGRVLTINPSTVFQTKRVHCEGAFAFLNDTFYEATKEKDLKKISWSDYIDKIIANHNKFCSSDESWKKIYRGNIDFTPTTENKKFEPTSWSDTASLLKNLENTYGGHFRLRRSGSKNYLDWNHYYTRDLGDNRPTVSVGKDIIDMNGTFEVENVFTHLIPIGSSTSSGNAIYIDGYSYKTKSGATKTHSGKSIPVPLLESELYSHSSLNDGFHTWKDYRDAIDKYGHIYKTQSFPNADNKQKLWDYAKDWIKNNYFGDVTSFSITAMDFHTQDNEVPNILVGECANVTYITAKNGTTLEETKKLVCSEVTYNLLSPETTNYTFGIPHDLLNAEYGKKKKSSSSTPISSATPQPKYEEEEPENISTFEGIYHIIRDDDRGNLPDDWYGKKCGDSYRSFGEKSGKFNNFYDPTEFEPFNPNYPNENRDKLFSANLVGWFVPGKARIEAIRYVWISRTCGIFATMGESTIDDKYTPVAHWYQKRSSKDKPFSYEDKNGTIVNDDSGEIWHVGSLSDLEEEGGAPVVVDPKSKKKSGGQDTSKGTIKVGVDLTKPNTWKVELNKEIKYKDKDGKVQTTDGGIIGNDIQLDEIPSFKTKMAVIDIVVANAVEANQIRADIAYIRQINSKNISADTYVSAQKISATNIEATNTVYAEHFKIISEESAVNNFDLTRCYAGLTIQPGSGEDAGKIFFNFSRADGTLVKPTPNFNMANTAFFQDAVKAAKDQGAAAVTIGAIKSIPPTGTSPDRKLNPGEWAKASGTYTDKDGHTTSISSVKWIQARNISLRKVPAAIVPGKTNTPVSKQDYDGLDDIVVAGDADLIPENIKSGVWLFGVKGSYSGGSVDDIRVSAPPISQYDRPSSATELSTWRNIIKDAYLNQKYLVFDVWLNGDSSRKTYYVNLGQ